MMTRKDFEELAAALRGRKVPDDTFEAIVRFLAGQNPRFDENRFREACGQNKGNDR